VGQLDLETGCIATQTLSAEMDAAVVCTLVVCPMPNVCMAGSGSSGTLGDWAQCSRDSQGRNGCCCSGMHSSGVPKCTPLSGGFNPNVCIAV
jgi:hypothetical protein